jgi:hypothetical protein|uniref:Uncharacterized protein n=1 Tax=viral metagenome TaxID=1070528 RepID=A0A6C0H3S0_9ZZZZ
MAFFDDLMAPFGKEHCMFFYYLGYISLAAVIFAFIGIIISLVNKNYKILGFAISYFLTFVLMYYIYRLHYSVCLGAYK